MASKGNIRSMRFSDEMIHLIEAQSGESFTAKFETLVRKCVQEVPEKERQLAEIQKSIDYERSRLKRIRTKAQELDNAMWRMSQQLQTWTSQTKAATDNISKLIDEK